MDHGRDRRPALRLPGAPVVASYFAYVTRQQSATLADNHLASPTMIHHCLDHLLSAYQRRYALSLKRGK